MSTNAERTVHPPPGRLSRHWLLLGAIIVCVDLLVAGGVLGRLGVRVDQGVAFGANGADNPVLHLGSTFDRSGCHTAPLAIGDGYRVICDDWGAITSLDYTTQVVSLYADGIDGFDEYTGPMPQSLRWHQGIEAVGAALGDPWRITAIYGTPTLVYTYSDALYGSLELRFDANDELVRINACLTH
ncbi:MAG: hypothetical protein ACYC65_04355 [Candidatus Limnocylindrales bacterium]